MIEYNCAVVFYTIAIVFKVSNATLHQRGFVTMDMEFRKGDFVVYGKNGVCLVEDIKTVNFAGENGTYYILKPNSSGSSTVYVPVANERLVSKMRSTMTKKQIDTMLGSAWNEEVVWNDDKNERLEEFNIILSSGDSRKLLLLVMCLNQKKKEKEEANKRLSATDENIMRTAEELIEEEFAFALGCTQGKVNDYIRKKLK